MASRRILFLSWQGGMGHVTRDLAIVKELRRVNPESSVSWLAHSLASQLIRQSGENLLPESEYSADYNQLGAQALSGFRLNLMKYVKLTRKARTINVSLFQQVFAKYPFDLVIGDESYEIADALGKGELRMDCHMVLIEDFIGLEAITHNPLEKIGVYQRNRARVLYTHLARSRLTHLFVGELDDIPDRRFGFLLPNRRGFAREYYHCLGYVIRFDPADYADKARTKASLGYGPGPLLICATGGTCAGKEMLEICGKAYPLLRKDIPDLHMVAVCGELFGLEPPQLPPEVELRTYIPDIYQHYAACDMAVVVGGGTTTVELTALRRPFIFFPLENQFDQQLCVAERLARHGAGIKMRYYETTVESLAQIIRKHIGRDVDWKPIPTDGAQKAALLINAILVGNNR